jgi:hypothetical protein
MDIAGPIERPTHIGFQSQKGDCGLQKGHWAPGWDGGALDILLRGSIRLFWNLAPWTTKNTLLL